MRNLIRDKGEKINLVNKALVASSRNRNKSVGDSSTAEYEELKKEHDVLINSHSEDQKRLLEHEREIDSKDQEISRLNEISLGLNDTPTISLKLTRTEGEMFRTKTRTKGSGKNINIQSNCEYPECKSTDVDTIRCNLCARWVCEGCQDAPVAKLKQIFNKCKTIYFLCQTCDQLQSENSREAVASKYLCEADRNNDSLNKIEEVLGRTVKEFESKLETLIDKKLDQKLKIIETFNENIKEQGSGSASDPLVIPSLADKLKDFREILRQTHNEEKLERREKEQRPKNFIVRGLA